MAQKWKVIIDAGHGGSDPGAVYDGRQEKDDALQLAFDLGNALERRGFSVVYTRVNDVYHSPYEKAEIGNNSDADIFVSIHRNAMPVPGTASGVESLVYENGGVAGLLAENIDAALAGVGWTDLGVKERPGLIVLNRTRMPAVLIEAGFLDNEEDNAFFDASLAATADAIADGILRTFEELTAQEAGGGGEKPVGGTAQAAGQGSAGAIGMAQAAGQGGAGAIGMPQAAESGGAVSADSGAGAPAGGREFPGGLYQIQVGAYRYRTNAEAGLEELRELGIPGYLVEENGLFLVRAGLFRELENAVRQEQELRKLGFSTWIVRT